jgi:hypothetical protein
MACESAYHIIDINRLTGLKPQNYLNKEYTEPHRLFYVLTGTLKPTVHFYRCGQGFALPDS